MASNETREFDIAAGETQTTRRVLFANAAKVIGAGALVATGLLGPARVAAQDEGLGAGGRTGGDGEGGGRRRRQDDAAAAPAGVGAGGRTDAPMVMAMPATGVGDVDSSVAPMLLAAGAVGAAALAIRTREGSTASSS